MNQASDDETLEEFVENCEPMQKAILAAMNRLKKKTKLKHAVGGMTGAIEAVIRTLAQSDRQYACAVSEKWIQGLQAILSSLRS